MSSLTIISISEIFRMPLAKRSVLEDLLKPGKIGVQILIYRILKYVSGCGWLGPAILSCGTALGLKSCLCARYASVTQLPRIVFMPVGTTARAAHTIYRVHDGDGAARLAYSMDQGRNSCVRGVKWLISSIQSPIVKPSLSLIERGVARISGLVYDLRKFIIKVDRVEFDKFANDKLKNNCTVIFFFSSKIIELKSNCLAGKSIMSIEKVFGFTRSQSSASHCDGKLFFE